MRLSKKIAPGLNGSVHSTPQAAIFVLPEKVLQFGTGVLLRGLPDYYIDKANKKGIFNGRIVVVKSTSQGDADAFETQDGLYTHAIRGIQNERAMEENIVNAAISRVLSAGTQWQQILECAANPLLQVVISNTTEAGLQLHPQDDISQSPPLSFPAKLLALLRKRYEHFNGDANSGMVILPTELISGNGDLLRSLVLDLARRQINDAAFLEWLDGANDFCNTLVDRIVPGRLAGDMHEAMEAAMGYHDDLMILSEPYHLWAIETNSERVKERLSFAQADAQVVLTGDIQKHRELKLRLLNATHTFSCALALLAGFKTVREAMEDAAMSLFIYDLMVHETAACITGDTISVLDAHEFAGKVLDRFRNPYIQHQWQSVSLHYSQKLKMRCVPLLLEYVHRRRELPEHMALGFAAYLLLMKSNRQADGSYRCVVNDLFCTLQDDQASYFEQLWRTRTTEELVKEVLGNEELWGANLLAVPGFEALVVNCLAALTNNNAADVIRSMQHSSRYAGEQEA